MSVKTAKIKSTVRTKTKMYLWRFNFTGLLFALAFFCLSLLPSLLPRPWLYQGLISGIVVTIGYAIGVAISKAWRWSHMPELPVHVKRIAWHIFAVVGPLLIILLLYAGANWQNEVRQLVGEQPQPGRHMVRILLLSLIVFILLLSISRGIRMLNHWLGNFADKWLPRRVAVVLSFVVARKWDFIKYFCKC